MAQLAPGLLAAQLAIYLGWVRGGLMGATLTGIAFVAPSFLMVVVLAWVYLRYGGLAWMQAVFYGIGAAVIAIIARGAIKLAERTGGSDPLLAAVMIASRRTSAPAVGLVAHGPPWRGRRELPGSGVRLLRQGVDRGVR